MRRRILQPLEVRREHSRASKARHPDRVRARRAVGRAIARGALVRPTACEVGGCRARPEAAHSDYARPLDVRWLCRDHHEQFDLATHCGRGHEYTPENTYNEPRGGRECRTCRRLRAAARRGES